MFAYHLIEGIAYECTVRTTDPGNPVYVYEPGTGETRDGVEGEGPVILAVDILPCELPVEASRYFSSSLVKLVPAISRADFSQPVAHSGLPHEIQRATILYNGRLTRAYEYLEKHVLATG